MALTLDNDDIEDVIKPLANYLHTAFSSGVGSIEQPSVLAPLPGYVNLPAEHQASSRDIFRLVAAAMVATGMGGGGGGPVHASLVAVTPTGNLTSTNVQDALVEHQGDIDTLVSQMSTTSGNLAAHIASATAHPASSITVSSISGLSATNVQDALAEIYTAATVPVTLESATTGLGGSLVKVGTGPNLVIRKIVSGGPPVSISTSTDEISISVTRQTLLSVGTGVSLVNLGTGANLQVKSLVNGPGITITPVGTTVEIASTVDISQLEADVSQLQSDVSTLVTDVTNVTDDLSDHISATSGAHAATAISTTPITGVTGTNVQSMLASIQSNLSSSGTTLSNHISQVTDAHDATAISTTAISGVSGINVQSMLASIQSNVNTVSSDLVAHTSQVTGAHDATAISVSIPGISATNVENALIELQGSSMSVLFNGNDMAPTTDGWSLYSDGDVNSVRIKSVRAGTGISISNFTNGLGAPDGIEISSFAASGVDDVVNAAPSGGQSIISSSSGVPKTVSLNRIESGQGINVNAPVGGRIGISHNLGVSNHVTLSNNTSTKVTTIGISDTGWLLCSFAAGPIVQRRTRLTSSAPWGAWVDWQTQTPAWTVWGGGDEPRIRRYGAVICLWGMARRYVNVLPTPDDAFTEGFRWKPGREPTPEAICYFPAGAWGSGHRWYPAGWDVSTQSGLNATGTGIITEGGWGQHVSSNRWMALHATWIPINS